jgi:hypothetical protein
MLANGRATNPQGGFRSGKTAALNDRLKNADQAYFVVAHLA